MAARLSASLTSRCAFAYAVRIVARVPACASRCVSRVVRKLTNCALAAVNCSSACRAWICTSGLESSRRTSPGFTCEEGCANTLSTRPADRAVMYRMCSGTRVPGPRRSRTIGPWRTESTHSVPRSTGGAAGESEEMMRVNTISTPTPIPPWISRFRFLTGARGISISDTFTKAGPVPAEDPLNPLRSSQLDGRRRAWLAAAVRRRDSQSQFRTILEWVPFVDLPVFPVTARMAGQPADYQPLCAHKRMIVESPQPQDEPTPPGRRPWQAPELTELPKLTDLTLISGIPG